VVFVDLVVVIIKEMVEVEDTRVEVRLVLTAAVVVVIGALQLSIEQHTYVIEPTLGIIKSAGHVLVVV
jgi:hypothetical protein